MPAIQRLFSHIEETDFIINYDIKYRMGSTDDAE